MIRNWKRTSPVRTKVKGYLFCVNPPWEGIRHWFVCAHTIEDAWENVKKMPCLTSLDTGTLRLHDVHLGRVFDDENWHLYHEHTTKQLCVHCCPQPCLLLEGVVGDWLKLRRLYVAEAQLRGLPPVE